MGTLKRNTRRKEKKEVVVEKIIKTFVKLPTVNRVGSSSSSSFYLSLFFFLSLGTLNDLLSSIIIQPNRPFGLRNFTWLF
jgi:hypothetical protein